MNDESRYVKFIIWSVKLRFFSVLFCSVLALLLTLSACAEMHDLSSASISQVYINSSGVMLMQVPGVSGYLSIGKVGNKTSELLYSTALAAKLSKQTNLWIRYWDSSGEYPFVGIIAIK